VKETEQDGGLMIEWKNRKDAQGVREEKESDKVGNGMQKIKIGEK
jgi:hypothetical protein